MHLLSSTWQPWAAWQLHNVSHVTRDEFLLTQMPIFLSIIKCASDRQKKFIFSALNACFLATAFMFSLNNLMISDISLARHVIRNYLKINISIYKKTKLSHISDMFSARLVIHNVRWMYMQCIINVLQMNQNQRQNVPVMHLHSRACYS